MENNGFAVPWGAGIIKLDLPTNWVVRGVLQPSALQPVNHVGDEVLRALHQPIAMADLEALISPGFRVAVVIDDSSRPTPVKDIFPLLLQQLELAGVGRSQVTIVPALGVHRPMEEAEVVSRIGGDLRGVRWENPDCDSPERMVFLGKTSRGTPVWINKTVAQADLVISVGCIEPHIIASFGGGYKNILPGVAGRETIAHNHALNCSPDTFNNVGRSIDNNPMRLDLEEACGLLKPPVFIVNAILDYRQRLVRVVAGDPIAAHREGVSVSSKLYGVAVDRPADVVISASHPMDIDLRQGVKALANTIRAVKPGGLMVTFVRAEEGTGVFGLANRKLPVGKSTLRILTPAILPLVPKLKLKGMGEEDRFFLYFALQAMRHAKLLMYAPTIPLGVRERLPFVDFVDRPDDAITTGKKLYPHGADVLIFPHGGITYPDLGSGIHS